MRTVEWHDGAVRMIDQRLLPATFEHIVFHDYRDVAAAITDMRYVARRPLVLRRRSHLRSLHIRAKQPIG